MGAKQWIGLALLFSVVLVSLVVTQFDWSDVQREAPERLTPITVSLYYGGEKSAFLSNAELLGALHRK